LNPENVGHFRRAGADETICTGDISSKLIFRSSIYPGVTNLFRELMTNNFGNEIYSGIVPDYLIDCNFEQAFIKLRESAAILIGVYQNSRFITNPPANTLLHKDDLLIYIAPNKVL
jgi:Trk K+ transport system NAD-binding subunit